MKLHFAFGIVLAIASACEARLTRLWTYEQLVSESDLVVIATAVETRDVDAAAAVVPNVRRDGPDGQPARVPAVGVETRFQMHAALKGELKDAKAKELVVYHLRQPAAAADAPEINGPTLVKFEGRRRYLLFLKRDADGRYAPTTGQTDPAIAVKDLGTYP